jgi:hypothetical protein
MSVKRTPGQKIAVVIAVFAVVWLVGSTMIKGTGGVNTAGLMPTAGSLIALWGALKSDVRLMWFGTAVVLVAAALLIFSVGLVVAPAGIALVIASVVLGRAAESEA